MVNRQAHLNNKLLAIGFAVVVTALSASSAQAQHGGTPMRSFGGARRFARSYRVRAYYPGGFWPGYYSDYDDSGYQAMPPPQIVEIAPPALPAAPPPPPAESLVLELQGDHWVRVTNGGGQSQTVSTVAAVSDSPAPAPRRVEAAAAPTPLPAAVLVYRDGHQEEIARYTISGASIVAPADYWTTGSWTRKILIADLNVPETLRLNQQRGAQFKLPSGPNEVIVRP